LNEHLTGEGSLRGIVTIILAVFISFTFGKSQGPGLDGPSPGSYNYRHSSPLVDLKPPIPWGGYQAIQANISYPDTALVIGLDGSVTIKCIINIDGYAEEIRPILGPGLLFSAAIEAAELSHWIPGRIDGQPVATEVTFDLDFHLPGTHEGDEEISGPINLKHSISEVLISGAFYTMLILFLRSV